MGKIRDIVAKIRRPKSIGGDIRTVFSMTYSIHNKIASKYKWYDNWHKKPYANKVHYSALGLIIIIATSITALAAGQLVNFSPNQTKTEAVQPTTLVAKDTSGDYKAKTGEAEQVDKRTESFKTFKKTENGKDIFRVAGQIGDIHYKTDPFSTTEQFKEIDLTLQQAQNKKAADPDYYMNQNGYQLNIWNQEKIKGKDLSYIAKFTRAGQNISMAPLSLAWENTAGEYQEIAKPVSGITPEIDNTNY